MLGVIMLTATCYYCYPNTNCHLFHVSATLKLNVIMLSFLIKSLMLNVICYVS